jgi:hypothetical protein
VIKKPEPQQWEATFTRAHLKDAVRAEIGKACIDRGKIKTPQGIRLIKAGK